MYVNGIQCDVCCKIHNKNVHSCPFPKKWISLQQDQQEQHFCSLHCLHEWVEHQMPVVENAKVSNVNLMPATTTVAHGERWRDL